MIFRDFLENNLIDFAKENPGVVVYVKPRRHRTPVIVAEYREHKFIKKKLKQSDNFFKYLYNINN